MATVKTDKMPTNIECCYRAYCSKRYKNDVKKAYNNYFIQCYMYDDNLQKSRIYLIDFSNIKITYIECKINI